MNESASTAVSVPVLGRMRIIFCLLLASIGICACSDRGRGSVEVQFHMAIGTEAAADVRDLRFYVSELELLDQQGRAQRVMLSADGRWQNEDVALIDLVGEDRNSAVRATVPLAEFTGIRFTVGVPFALNHANPMTALPPLNRGDLFWSWQSGYKFMRVDLADAAREWSFHLGSTGCVSASAVRAPAQPCAQPNRLKVELRGFDPTREAVRVRVDELFLSMRAPKSGTCTGGYAHDPACADVVAKTGLRTQDGVCEGECRGQRLFSAPR